MRSLVIVLLLSSVHLQAQQLPSYLNYYFHLEPVKRLDLLDSLVKNKGDVTRADFASYDISALLGDTTRIGNYYDYSGYTMRVTTYDDAKISKVFKRWRKLLDKKTYFKGWEESEAPDYSMDNYRDDTLTTFFEWYVMMPPNNRISYYEQHATDSTELLRIETVLMFYDLNAITGANCAAPMFDDKQWIILPADVKRNVAAWRNTLK